MKRKGPRIGLFGARADMRGLAYQTQSYAKHLPFERIYGVDLTEDGLSPYPCDWRPYTSEVADLSINTFRKLDEKDVRRWLRGLDVVLGAETFYRDEFPIWAREAGVKTILQVNPEFVGWWDPRGKDQPKPDVLLAPTTWRINLMPGAIHLPFPVDREEFPYRQRIGSHFVHIAGHRAQADRAGTRMLLSVLPRLKDHNITIRSQSPLGFTSPVLRHANVEQINHPDRRFLYNDADVIILLRRYGGNCLVANEALSCGCPIIMLDRNPENEWGGVIKLKSRARGNIRTKAGLVPLHETHPGNLTILIKQLTGDPGVVARYSEEANRYADSISWDTLLPRYMDLLTE